MRQSHKIAQRMELIDASGIRKVFDLAAKLTDPINLSIGQPDFDVPQPAKDEAVSAIRRGENKYTQTQGTAVYLSAADTFDLADGNGSLLLAQMIGRKVT